MPGSSALIVIDMLNPYEHDDADELAANIAEVIEPLSELIAWARESDGELIYVNDNYGDFAASNSPSVRAPLLGLRPAGRRGPDRPSTRRCA